MNLRLDGDHFRWVDKNEASVLTTILEADDAGDLREQRVIFAATNVQAGLERCATLTNNDAATENCLTAKYLDAKPLRI